MSMTQRIILIVLSLLLLCAGGAFARFWFMMIPVDGTYLWTTADGYASSTLTGADVDALLKLRNPTWLDLRGSNLNEAEIARLSGAFPDCDIRWSMVVNGQTLENDTTEVTLDHPSPADLAALHRLPLLRTVNVKNCTDYAMLRTAESEHPNWTWNWSVASAEVEIDHTVNDWTVDDPLSAETLFAVLPELTNLKTVTLRDKALSNADIAALVAAFPALSFDYRVSVGGVTLSPDVTSLTLGEASGITDVSALADALPYLPALESVDLEPLALGNAQLKEALSLLDGLTLHYTVELFGERVSPDLAAIDLQGKEIPSARELTEALPLLPKLTTVLLGERSGARADIVAFMEANPTLTYDYTFTVEYLGHTYTEATEELDLSNTPITDVDTLKYTLTQLPNLKHVNMLGCGLDDRTMGGLADAFPHIKFLWEIDLGFWGKLRTDATAFTTRSSKKGDEKKYRLTTEAIWPLQYCTELVALDLGHQQIEDISVLKTLTKLQILILADNRIKDISALRYMPDLVYVELFINHIEDVSPLADHDKLLDLNLCTNHISDVTPLMTLKNLERLWYSGNLFKIQDHDAMRAALPNCICNRTVYDETSDGWRTHERYYWMIAFFKDAPRYK